MTYRWPIALAPDAEDAAADSGRSLRRLSSRARPTSAYLELEVPPRGAAMMLPALAHVGHPIHLSLIDAYLRGMVPVPRGQSLGGDSQVIAASLAGPLILLYERRVERAGLAELILLPPRSSPGAGSRFLLTTNPTPLWLDCAPTLARPIRGRRHPDPPQPPWHEIAVQLPAREAVNAALANGSTACPVDAASRRARITFLRPEGGRRRLFGALRTLSLGRAGRSPGSIRRGVAALRRTVEEAWVTAGADERPFLQGLLEDAVTEATDHGVEPSSELERLLLDPIEEAIRGTGMELLARSRRRGRAIWDDVAEAGHVEPDRLGPALVRSGDKSTLVTATSEADGHELDVALAPDPDGGSTLALLPHAEDVADSVGAMRTAAWSALEGLLEIRLEDRRTEEVALQLAGPERTTELAVGWSLVLPRNRRVFAAWLGTDGRVLIRLMPSR